MALQKAFLETETGQRINCLFNPAHLTVTKANQWVGDLVPGRQAPNLYFTGGHSGTLQAVLTFDTTADGSAVTAHTHKLFGLMAVDKQLPGYDNATKRGRPPWVKLHWGDFHSFAGVVQDLQVDFTYFAANGTPLRAKAAIVLRQFEEEGAWGPQNPTSGTPEPQRVHRVQVGETLDRIAATHYGDSARWRVIADANRVEDPLALAPGVVLTIPRLEGGTPGDEEEHRA
jgi:Contractile injection system tube protein/LysM domain